MRTLLPILLVALVAGCHFEPRDAPADEAVAGDAAPAQAEGPPARPAVTPPAAPAVAPGDRPEVVLYVTEWCPYCSQARDFMAEQQIPHRVVDIEASAENSAEYQAMGGTGGIPLVAVGTETIEGWSAGAARQMLDAAGYD